MINLNNYIISSISTIEDVLILINKNKFKIAIVCEVKTNKVLGTISDGDIRRHLIKNGNVTDGLMKVCKKDFIYLKETDSSDQLLKIFDRNIQAVPILNDKMRLVDLKSVNDFGIKN